MRRNHASALIFKKLRAIANGKSLNSLVARPDFTDLVTGTMNRVEDYRRIRVWPRRDPTYNYQLMLSTADETNADLTEEAFYRNLNRPRGWYDWAYPRVPMFHIYGYDHSIREQYALWGRDAAPDYDLNAFAE